MAQIYFFRLFFLAVAVLIFTQIMSMIIQQHYSFDTLLQLGLFLILLELGFNIKPADAQNKTELDQQQMNHAKAPKSYAYHLSKIGLGTIAFSLILPNLL